MTVSDSTRPVVFGTAGHIDHGKSTLVEALTETAMDRLPEEQARGISIDLGFARLDLGPDAPPASFVDVPGHEAFVKNMVAGASGVDGALIVVAADEGVMPQTIEHIIVLEALGVPAGVVAITKVDLVEPEWIPLVTEAIDELLEGTSLAGARIVPTSVRTGEGIDDLREALRELAEGLSSRSDAGIARLPVDRAFSVVGVGTVATGTVRGRPIEQGASLDVLPDGGRVRVRTIETHGVAVERVGPGSRAALAVSGPDSGRIERGTVLVEAGSAFEAQTAIDASIWLTDRATRAIESGDRLRVHHGTREVMARVRWYDVATLHPGGEAIGRVALEAPIVAAVGDRLVIRTYSPVMTIGGGTVVALGPRRLRGRRASDRGAMLRAFREKSGVERVLAVLELAGPVGVAVSRLPIETGFGQKRIEAALADAGSAVLRLGDRAFASEQVGTAIDRAVEAVRTHQRRNPLREGMPLELVRAAIGRGAPAFVEHAIDEALAGGLLVRRGATLAEPGAGPEVGAEILDRVDAVAEVYREAGLEAPDSEDVSKRLGLDIQGVREAQHYLVRQGSLVRLATDWYADASAVESARDRIVERIREEEGLDTGACKAVLGVSRKYLIPILEHFDATGATRREGNVRVLGPEA